MKEQLLHEVRFAHRNNSLLSHSTFGALIGSPDHAVRRRPNLQLLHVFVTQLLSHVHHLITWGAARRAVSVGSGQWHVHQRSTYGISLYVHQRHQPVPASCCRASHWTSSIDRSNDTTPPCSRIHKDSFVFAFPQFMWQKPTYFMC